MKKIVSAFITIMTVIGISGNAYSLVGNVSKKDVKATSAEKNGTESGASAGR